ncbi:class I SAM-dependent DNA methyltransferase [Pseudotabrizicola sediminis]|uniref:site-specific DNA-methyltransferase (adenine-specific) n=2 Tax=Pseudotabrizicola sediminis TaxID=2486418 RepID=A0ABY2KIU2_9RHOB|nr:class I SAM-dependent DNA methyltransferase [Pseudotabrizicola sediminis]
MSLSQNEIRSRAAGFAREWAGHGYEKGETQLFYREFFDVFGVPVRRVATFEQPVKGLGEKRGFIDLFWKGVLLVEQKSIGLDLVKARKQALEYFPGLKDNELPRFVLLSDFQSFELYDLENDEEVAFPLADLPKHVDKFGFITGREKKTFKDQDPVNIKASELVGALHDALEDSGYNGHDLERFLVRIVFCLFADDTGIFEPRGIFEDLVERRTNVDGSDLGGWLTMLFQTLDTETTKRPSTLDEDLAQFPYVNGSLFQSNLRMPAFNSAMRERLIAAARFNWSNISPAIFGSLFQSVMNREERRNQGAHYTNETNIVKVIRPLFMDELWAEFERIKGSKRGRKAELQRFQVRLGELNFLDPACGCGNFLVISYRELRTLEIEVVRELVNYDRDSFGQFSAPLDVSSLSIVNVDQFYGIELVEFAARIAETAMWMMDHIMNNRLSLEFGPYYSRIPLRKSPHILQGNALTEDWTKLLAPAKCSYVLGNPPFRGHQFRSLDQQADMARVWGTSGQYNRLDYVACWFRKAVEYAASNREIDIALVSTNSITQGEQCGILWPWIFSKGIHIHFAHRSFQWNSEARGKAAVHCVIVGMTQREGRKSTIFEYDHIRGNPHASSCKRINGYLIDGPQYSVPARSKPPAGRLKMNKGSQPTDGARLKKPGGGYTTKSNLILNDTQRAELLAREPGAAKWLRPYVGGDELISGKWRWCLWLKDVNPSQLRASAAIQERLDRVRVGRNLSPTDSVREFAKYPWLFTQDRQPSREYLGIPEVSSEHREYIPMAVLPPDVIASNKLQIIVGAPLLYFAVLTSSMHMAWMRTVAGRLESRFSYAPAVYNSFPWPNLTAAQQSKIEALGQGVLDSRQPHLVAGQTLEDLYDPDAMPVVLRKAHQALDKAVDKLYRKEVFRFERERVEHLFELFEKVAAPLDSTKSAKQKKSQKV